MNNFKKLLESLTEAKKLPTKMVKDYVKRADAERDAGGGIDIDPVLPSISVTLSDGTDYYFQEHEARKLLKDVPSNISPEDYILAQAQNW